MKKTLLLVLILVLTSLYFFKQKTNPPIEVEMSGAYEALSQLSSQRSYPFDDIPDRAHYIAWESTESLRTLEKDNPPTDPWQTIGPHNRGGRTLELEFNPQNPNTIYVGSASGGLWRSYTAGFGDLAWEQVETGFPVLAVSCITFAPGDSSTMYIGTGEVYNYFAAGTGAAYRSTRGSYGMGILKSTDGGNTWEKSLDWSYNQQRGIWGIRISQQNPNLVYAATTEGVYKSTDAGENWIQIHNVVMATDLLVHPDDDQKLVVSCGNFSSTGFGVYKSEDGGVNWQKITTGIPSAFNGKMQLALAPSNPDIVYLSIGDGFTTAEGASWLCRSDDFGSTFAVQTTMDYSRWQGWFAHDVAVKPDNPNDITVIGINVWRSVNAGQDLSQSSGGIHVDCHDVTYHPTNPNIVYVVSDGGVYRSENAGQSYVELNGAYQTAQFYNGFSNSQQDTLFAIGGLQDNGTIRWNGDLTWTRISGGDGSWTAIDANNDNRLYASSQGLNLRRSENRGNSFNSIIPPGGNTVFIAPYVIAYDYGEVIYAGRDVIYKSIDAGETWTATNGGFPLDGNPTLSMAISQQNPNVVYAATAPSANLPGVFVTTNNGSSWTNITQNLPNRYPMDMTVDPTNEAVAYITYSGFGTGHVFKTTDYGENWTDISAELPDVPTNAVIVDPLFPDHVYVGNDIGVFVSTNGGDNWEAYQEGLSTATMIFDLKISHLNRKLRAATHGNGAYQRDLLDEVTSVKEVLVIEGVTSYPNPFRDQSTLQYELKETGQVTIQLLNASGQLIRTLLNEQQFAGTNEVQIQRQELSSGIYFCRLSFQGQQKVHKLVIN